MPLSVYFVRAVNVYSIALARTAGPVTICIMHICFSLL